MNSQWYIHKSLWFGPFGLVHWVDDVVTTVSVLCMQVTDVCVRSHHLKNSNNNDDDDTTTTTNNNNNNVLCLCGISRKWSTYYARTQAHRQPGTHARVHARTYAHTHAHTFKRRECVWWPNFAMQTETMLTTTVRIPISLISLMWKDYK